MSQFAHMADEEFFSKMDRLKAKQTQERLDRLSYAILENDTKIVLETQVINYMKEGWKPSGGIAITYDVGRRKLIYTQAMVRE